MLAASRPSPTRLEDLIDPALAARLDRLDLLSRKLLSGKLPGERRSKRRGRSVEFDDFRTYVPGDDLRHIDWNVYARLERLFIKIFREEEDLSLHLIVDASPSMEAGTPQKLHFAARLAMALAYIGLVNQNRVALTVFGRGASVQRLAPCRGRTNLRRVADVLLRGLAAPGAGQATQNPDDVFSRVMLAQIPGARGIVCLLSDLLAPGECERGLNYLGAASASGMVDAYAIQVLSPGEIDPRRDRDSGLLGDLRLTDAETALGAEVTVSPASIAHYLKESAAYRERLRARCASRGVAHLVVASDARIDQLVLSSLRKGGLLR